MSEIVGRALRHLMETEENQRREIERQRRLQETDQQRTAKIFTNNLQTSAFADPEWRLEDVVYSNGSPLWAIFTHPGYLVPNIAVSKGGTVYQVKWSPREGVPVLDMEDGWFSISYTWKARGPLSLSDLGKIIRGDSDV